MARRETPPARRALRISKRGRFTVAEPLFERGEQLPLARGRVRVEPGGIALCRVDQRGAQPIADLGRADVARDLVGALLAQHELRIDFPEHLESEARSAVDAAQRLEADRRDLRELATFTVDPASARDFDDAVSARKDNEGWRLWIHIADVAAHVRPGSGLDEEAARRANSTYAPGWVAPMLPRVLSNEACSLNPGVDRLAVTAEISLAESGETRSASFYRSLIRSDVRLDYDELDRIFAGRERPPEVAAEPVAAARSAAAALGELGDSGLVVAGSEPDFSFDDDGNVREASVVEQTESHRLIERLMVLCNSEVATMLERRDIPVPYRVHEQPDPARIARLGAQLDALDLPSPPIPDPEALSPSEAGELAVKASQLLAKEAERRGHGAAPWSSLVLRSLKQARYSEHNLGHAGLGLAAYSHFTSPIRRYPDLLAHRALLAAVGEDEVGPGRGEVAAVCEHCSETERDSMRIERDGDDICLAFLLQRELSDRGPSQKFKGEVSGVIGAGAFIRFTGERSDAYEGFLAARRMPGDFYELDQSEVSLVGSRTGRKVGFGSEVEVVVDSVEPARGRVDLSPPADGRGRDRRRGSGGRDRQRKSSPGSGRERGASGGKTGDRKSSGGKGGKNQAPGGKASGGKGSGGKGRDRGSSGGRSRKTRKRR